MTQNKINPGGKLKSTIKASGRSNINDLPKTTKEFEQYRKDAISEMEEALNVGEDEADFSKHNMWKLHHLLHKGGRVFPNSEDLTWLIECLIRFFCIPENSLNFFSMGTGIKKEDFFEDLNRLKDFFSSFETKEGYSHEEIELLRFNLIHDCPKAEASRYTAKNLQYIRILAKKYSAEVTAAKEFSEELDNIGQ